MKKYILIFLSAFLFSLSVSARDKAVNIYEVPRNMPQREIFNEFGHKIKLDSFKGEFVLLMVWSRNCTPCVKELKNINGFVNKTREDKIRVVMLSPNTEWNTLEEQRYFVNKFGGSDLELYTDKDGKLAEDLGIFTSPFWRIREHTKLRAKKFCNCKIVLPFKAGFSTLSWIR